jgi:hypothetical protein
LLLRRDRKRSDLVEARDGNPLFAAIFIQDPSETHLDVTDKDRDGKIEEGFCARFDLCCSYHTSIVSEKIGKVNP